MRCRDGARAGKFGLFSIAVRRSIGAGFPAAARLLVGQPDDGTSSPLQLEARDGIVCDHEGSRRQEGSAPGKKNRGTGSAADGRATLPLGAVRSRCSTALSGDREICLPRQTLGAHPTPARAPRIFCSLQSGRVGRSPGTSSRSTPCVRRLRIARPMRKRSNMRRCFQTCGPARA